MILEWIKKGLNLNHRRHVIKINIINARPWIWLSLTFDLEYKFEIQTWNITWQFLHIIWTPDSSNEISSNCGIFLNFFEVILTEFVIFDSLIFASLFELFVVRNLRKSLFQKPAQVQIIIWFNTSFFFFRVIIYCWRSNISII